VWARDVAGHAGTDSTGCHGHGSGCTPAPGFTSAREENRRGSRLSWFITVPVAAFTAKRRPLSMPSGLFSQAAGSGPVPLNDDLTAQRRRSSGRLLNRLPRCRVSLHERPEGCLVSGRRQAIAAPRRWLTTVGRLPVRKKMPAKWRAVYDVLPQGVGTCAEPDGPFSGGLSAYEALEQLTCSGVPERKPLW
jgi:hypothetical protein